MARPKLFIGSSQKNLRVAQILADSLEECAEVTIWNEGVFGLGYGFLETLVRKLEDYDFAAFILAPDDMTTSKDEAKPAPRDNVLFESGLFMGVLGRDRVFLVYDQTVGLKIPSDLAGVTLATYDGTRIDGDDAAAAIRKASRQISDRIKASRFPHLVGEWMSEYPLTFEEGSPTVSEEMSVRTSGDCLYLVTKTSSHDDFYTAWGRMALDRQIIGKWKSFEGTNNMEGIFMLTVSPDANYMYGYFTSPDEIGGIVYASWLLVKMTDSTEAEINERMARARNKLKKITIVGPTPPTTS
ncbi:MAG TPA: nucleotide-binding protein [Pyrinomonadaceae bacterium]|nr:nucleotide-binding protein [Pyrinomonadaceae bacterium]